MLSVVMPYWNRNRELNLTLQSYQYQDIEVIIVDDGSPHAADPVKTDFPVKVIRLPYKPSPKNPCVPINVGISEAKGDWIAITNPEVRHPTPVFQDMMTDHYVLAACWDAAVKNWLCHSEKTYPTPMPPGYGLHFCGVIPRDQIEPFDEAYRDGAGYDDNDWAWTLHSKGVQCEIRDDLVVEHVRGERINWGKGFPINKRYFQRKWNLSSF